MTFDLTAHAARQHRKTAVELIKEACLMIAGCTDPERRFRAMIELRRMQAMAF